MSLVEPDGPRQRAAETKRKRTYEQIVTATVDLYAEEGEGDYTREQIADAAGVGVATLHNHFSSKYGVLRAAYERVLAPVVDPIVRAGKVNAYNPADPLQELCNYMYSVSSLNRTYQALAVSMVRSYFDPTVLPNPGASDTALDVEQRLGWPVCVGMLPIVSLSPFKWTSPISADRTINQAVCISHSAALLMQVCYSPSSQRPEDTARFVLNQLLPGILANFSGGDITERVKRAVSR